MAYSYIKAYKLDDEGQLLNNEPDMVCEMTSNYGVEFTTSPIKETERITMKPTNNIVNDMTFSDEVAATAVREQQKEMQKKAKKYFKKVSAFLKDMEVNSVARVGKTNIVIIRNSKTTWNHKILSVICADLSHSNVDSNELRMID